MSILPMETGIYEKFSTSSKTKMSELSLFEVALMKRVVDEFIESGEISNNNRYCAENLSMYVLSPWLMALENNREYVVSDRRTVGQLKIIYDACVYSLYAGITDKVTLQNIEQMKIFLECMLKRDYGSDKDFSQYKYNSTK